MDLSMEILSVFRKHLAKIREKGRCLHLLHPSIYNQCKTNCHLNRWLDLHPLLTTNKHHQLPLMVLLWLLRVKSVAIARGLRELLAVLQAYSVLIIFA